MTLLRELLVLALLLLVPASLLTGVAMSIATGNAVWLNLGWLAPVSLAVLVLYGGRIGGHIRTRLSDDERRKP
ncbi:MAG: hypothetical protein WD379_04700 [Dehalococcoidia bacterium]